MINNNIYYNWFITVICDYYYYVLNILFLLIIIFKLNTCHERGLANHNLLSSSTILIFLRSYELTYNSIYILYVISLKIGKYPLKDRNTINDKSKWV